MGYSLLNGIRVLEVAWLAGDTLGQNLADMGAEVIKLERPGEGDYVRTVGAHSLGGDEGLSFMHLDYNRGKKSVELDLKSQRGRETFLRLVEKSHIVIEGLRAGAMSRWDLGYDVLKERNPAIIFASLSGMGASGPYKDLPTHGFLYDAFTGLAAPVYRDGDDIPRVPGEKGGLLEYKAGGLYATIGVLSALIRAMQTGQGTAIDVSQTDAMALIRSEKLELAVNRDKVQRRKSYGGGEGFAESTRSSYYSTQDGKVVFVQALEAKFWDKFCRGVGRPDMLERFPGRYSYDHDPGNEVLRQELQNIFKSRPLSEWVEFFIEQDIPGGPVYNLEELLQDRHFRSRANLQEVDYPGLGPLKLATTPVRIQGEEFKVELAPTLGEHTAEVLQRLNGNEPKEGGG